VFGNQIPPAVTTAENKLKEFNQTAQASKSPMEQLAASVRYVAAGFAGLWVVKESMGFLKGAVKLAMEDEQVELKLGAILRATGKDRTISTDSLVKEAMAMQKLTNVGHDEILNAQALLLTHETMSKDVLPRATKAVLNMSKVLGIDMRGAAMAMGKASDENLGTLGRYGVVFSDAQKKMIKALNEAGREGEAFDIVLNKIEASVNGVAETMAKSAGGQLDAMRIQFTQFKEDIGTEVLPAVSGLAVSFKNLWESMSPDKSLSARISEGVNAYINYAQVLVDAQTQRNRLADAEERLHAAIENKKTGKAGEYATSALDAEIKAYKKLNELAGSFKQPKSFNVKASGELAPEKAVPVLVDQEAAKKARELAEKNAEEMLALAKDLQNKTALIGMDGRDKELTVLRNDYKKYKEEILKKDGDLTALAIWRSDQENAINAAYNEKEYDEALKQAEALKKLNEEIFLGTLDEDQRALQELENKYDAQKASLEEYVGTYEGYAADLLQLEKSYGKQKGKLEADQAKKSADIANKEKEERIAAVQGYTNSVLDNLQQATEGYKTFGVAYKALATTEAVIDTWSGASTIFTSTLKLFKMLGPAAIIPAGLAAGAVVASGISRVNKINSAKFASGGIIDKPTYALMGEAGREAVLNSRATERVGVGNVNALNSGQSIEKRIINQISYNPTYNLNGTATADVISLLKQDKSRFADFMKQEMLAKGYMK
jgi:hypothetical protein